MLDLSHIPNSQQDVKIFYAVSGSNSWQTWQKPRKCSYVWIMCIGSGGGGGAGFTTNGQAWNGGGSGAVTRALFNSSHLPDTLYIQVGIGGRGATTNGASPTSGNKSYISLLPNVTIQNLVLTSGATAATTAGAAETAATTANMVFATLGNFISTAGSNPSGIVDTPALTSTIVTNGGYGGIINYSLGFPQPTSIQSSSISPLIRGGIGPVSGSGQNGENGITSWKPFYSLGGGGGGASADGTGGNGGNGGIGSGGGSGGGGPVAVGRGGNGGDGLVVLVAF